MVCLLFLCGPVFAAGTEFARAPGFSYAGPAAAKGVLVWVPGTYGRDQTGPPDPPDFVSREAAAGMDVWCFLWLLIKRVEPGGSKNLWIPLPKKVSQKFCGGWEKWKKSKV